MVTPAKRSRRRSATQPSGARRIDEALLVLLLGAMDANKHVSPDEGARAHHLIWSTRRFRRKSGDVVNALIERARARLETPDSFAVVAAAARAIPKHLRAAAFAVAVDLALADGRMDRTERRFLRQLGGELGLDDATVGRTFEIILTKNAL